MLTLDALATFVAAVVVLAATPGPDMMLLISRGVGHGPRMAFYTAVGFTLAGLCVLGTGFVRTAPGQLRELHEAHWVTSAPCAAVFALGTARRLMRLLRG